MPGDALAIFRAGGLIYNVQAADSYRGALENGHTDYKAIVRALKEIQYLHYVTLEPVPREADLTNISNPFSPAVSEAIMDSCAEQSIGLLRLYESLAWVPDPLHILRSSVGIFERHLSPMARVPGLVLFVPAMHSRPRRNTSPRCTDVLNCRSALRSANLRRPMDQHRE
jgi:hypothetical protein